MAGVSSLLRSANAARKKVLAQQDAEMAYEYSTGFKTYDDFKRYQDYLEKRAKSGVDPSTALTLQKTADSAFKGYVSNEIQRQSINVMEGRGSKTDKYNTIYGFMKQAMDAGQYDLAQGLNLQLDNLYTSIQSEAESQARAAETLQKAQMKAEARGYGDMGRQLENGLEDLTRAFKLGGQEGYNKAAKKFVDSNRGMLKELGIDLPKDATTNIGQVVRGTVEAVYNYYNLAAQADPDNSDTYLAKMDDIVSGTKTFSTPVGKLGVQDIQKLADSPNAFVESTDASGNKILKKSSISGYVVDGTGKAIPQYTGQTSRQLIDAKGKDNTKNAQKQLEKLGFKNIKYDAEAGAFKVNIGTANGWMPASKFGRSKNAEIYLTPTDTGFQFLDNNDGALYQITQDKKGLAGLYKVNSMSGPQHIQGQYGFNQKDNNLVRNIGAVVAPRTWVAPLLPGKTLQPSMVQRKGGGFNFTDANGRPISALTYANLTKQSFRTVLGQMAQKGDTFATTALKYAGNDGAYNPATVDLGTSKNWNALTWGNQVKLQTPQAARVAQFNSGKKLPLF